MRGVDREPTAGGDLIGSKAMTALLHTKVSVINIRYIYVLGSSSNCDLKHIVWTWVIKAG